MCKFVVFHSEEFEDALWAFLLGVLVTTSTVLVEFVNIINALHENTLTEVMTKFIAFKILIVVQDFYLRSRANFKVKAAVAEEPLVIITDMRKINGPFDENSKNKPPQIPIKTLFYIYKLLRMFYTCFYFYFMHFLVIAVPIYGLLFSSNANEMKCIKGSDYHK